MSLQAALVLGEALQKDGDNPFTQFMAFKLAMAQGDEDKGGLSCYPPYNTPPLSCKQWRFLSPPLSLPSPPPLLPLSSPSPSSSTLHTLQHKKLCLT